MFDTIKSTLITPELPRATKQLLDSLDNLKEHVNTNTGEVYHTGLLRNLRLSVSGERLGITGSFAKFLLKDNVQSLTRQSMENSVFELSNCLGLDVSHAKVNRVDLAQNLRVNHPPKTYYSVMLDAQYFKRLPQANEGMYYSNSQRQMVFYDKLKESKLNRNELPWLGDKYLLRYELRLLKKPHERLNRQPLTLSDLHDETVYMELVDLLFDHFELIPKADRKMAVEKEVVNTKTLQQLVIACGVQSLGGKQQLLEFIEELKLTKDINPVLISRMKKWVKELELQGTEGAIEQLSLSDELTQRMALRSKFYR